MGTMNVEATTDYEGGGKRVNERIDFVRSGVDEGVGGGESISSGKRY